MDELHRGEDELHRGEAFTEGKVLPHQRLRNSNTRRKGVLRWGEAAWEGGGSSQSVVAWFSGRELAALWGKEGTGTLVGSGHLWGPSGGGRARCVWNRKEVS